MSLIEKKIEFVAHKLLSIRRIKNLRLNINFFRVLCLLIIRMGLINQFYANATDKRKYEIKVHKLMKRFCFIPVNCANKTIRLIMQDINVVAERMVDQAKGTVQARELRTIAQKKGMIKKCPSPIQVFPNHTIQLMGKMYLNVCVSCRNQPQMSENHILREH